MPVHQIAVSSLAELAYTPIRDPWIRKIRFRYGMKLVGRGSQYAWPARDANGNLLDGGNSYGIQASAGDRLYPTVH
jgi:hypothetical protein